MSDTGQLTELEARLKDEALSGRLPLLRHEREYSTRGILATGFTYSVAAWCFLIGGYAANVVGAVQGLVTLIMGCMIGVMFSAAAAALACNRYGLEQIDYTKSCFGQRGAKLILVFYVINQVGWTGMILVMFGKGVTNVAKAFELVGADGSEHVVRLAVLAGLVLAYVIVIRGVHVLNVFNAIVTPGLIAVAIYLYWMIFSKGGWSGVASKAPLWEALFDAKDPSAFFKPSQDPRLAYVVAFEYGLGAGFSWWPGIGFLARNTDTQRNSLYPQILTMGTGMGVVCCTGLLAGLLFGIYDPTVWMIEAGGKVGGALALLLVAIANVSASAIMMYTAALGMKHVRFLRSIQWPRLVLLAFVPTFAYVAMPSYLYDNGSSWLTYNATMFAPISGILLVDWFLLRKQRLNASQIFEDAPSGDYRFVGGFNIPALGCMLLGQVLYVWLLNPVNCEPHGPVRYTTASGPSVLLPMIVYFLIAKLWLVPAGLGGYGAPTAPRKIEDCNI